MGGNDSAGVARAASVTGVPELPGLPLQPGRWSCQGNLWQLGHWSCLGSSWQLGHWSSRGSLGQLEHWSWGSLWQQGVLELPGPGAPELPGQPVATVACWRSLFSLW